MIDLHAHLLPALDDGPGSLAGSVDMARAAHAAGIRTMVCTPHMSDRYPTDPRAVEAGVAVVSEALDLAGVPLRVLQGGEIALSHLARLDEEGLRAASIGGGGRWLLLEMPFQGWPIALPQILADLEIQGYGAILAHPERAESIQRAPDRIRDLVGRGALVQLTAASFLGEHGPAARRAGADAAGGRRGALPGERRPLGRAVAPARARGGPAGGRRRHRRAPAGAALDGRGRPRRRDRGAARAAAAPQPGPPPRVGVGTAPSRRG